MATAAEVLVTFRGDASGVGKAAGDAEKATGGLMDKLGKAGPLLAGGMAIGATAVIGLGAAALSIGGQFDDAYDKIQLGTGATGKSLDGLKDTFKNVVSSVPVDFDTASSAITTLASRTGQTGPALEALSTQVLNLSRITGQDATAAATAAADTFGKWGIATGDQAKVLDDLFKASQASGVGVDVLEAAVSKNASTLKAAGFDINQATALVAGLGKAGIDASEIMPGLTKALGAAAKAGKDPSTALADIFAKVKKEGPESATAMEVFGKKGLAMAAAISTGKLSVEDMQKAMGALPDGINAAAGATDDFGQKFALLKNKVTVALEPLGNAAMDAMGKLADAFLPLVDKVAPILTDVSKKVSDFIASLTSGGAGGKVSAVFSDIGKAVGSIPWDTITAVIGKAFQDIGTAIAAIPWATIVAAVGSLAEAFMTGLGVILPIVGALFTNVLLPAFTALWNFIGPFVPIIAGLGAAFLLLSNPIGIAIVAITAIGLAATALGPIWDGIVAALAALGASIAAAWQSFLDAISTALDAIGTAITTSWDSFTSAISGALDDIASLIRLQWDAFLREITTKLTAILDAVTTAWTAVQKAVDDTLAVLGAAIKTAWDAMLATVTGALDSIDMIVGSTMSSIQDLIQAGMDAAKGIIKAAWELVTGDFEGALDTIEAVVSDGFDAVIAAVANILESLPDVVGIPLGDAWKKFGTFGDDVLTALSDLANNVLTAAGTIGTNISDGIKAAITSTWDSLVAKVKALVDLLPQVVRDLLGIHSPSTVFAAIGRNIVMGMADGITGAQDIVIRAASGVAQAAVAGVQNALAAGLSGGAGSTVGGVAGVISAALIRELERVDEIVGSMTTPHGMGLGSIGKVDWRHAFSLADHSGWLFGEGWGNQEPGPKGGPYARHLIGQGKYGSARQWGALDPMNPANRASFDPLDPNNPSNQAMAPSMGRGSTSVASVVAAFAASVVSATALIQRAVGGSGSVGGGSSSAVGGVGSVGGITIGRPGGGGVDPVPLKPLTIIVQNVIDGAIVGAVHKTTRYQGAHKRYRAMHPGAT